MFVEWSLIAAKSLPSRLTEPKTSAGRVPGQPSE
jgi:hypothetical protein